MEILRVLIFFYCFLGIFISGGLFFYKRSVANISLALFILFFTLEQLDFLYTTSPLLEQYPQYFLIIYPICFLFGPTLWIHFKYVKNSEEKFHFWELVHLIPFLLFIFIFLFPLFRFSGVERLAYSHFNFEEKMMPMNYLRTTHVSLYGVVMVYFILKEKVYKIKKQGIYLTLIVAIYFVSAMLQSYLTSFADSYRQFVIYFFLASTIILISGFILYAYPNILQQIHQKYFSSNLNDKERKRIAAKIEQLDVEERFFLNSEIDLKSFCEMIGERPHYVSQVFSEEFATSFSNFINKKRVDYAKKMLQDPEFDNLKILAIAFDSGFNNNVTFNKAFVKFCGMTPGKFRKQSRKKS